MLLLIVLLLIACIWYSIKYLPYILLLCLAVAVLSFIFAHIIIILILLSIFFFILYWGHKTEQKRQADSEQRDQKSEATLVQEPAVVHADADLPLQEVTQQFKDHHALNLANGVFLDGDRQKILVIFDKRQFFQADLVDLTDYYSKGVKQGYLTLALHFCSLGQGNYVNVTLSTAKNDLLSVSPAQYFEQTLKQALGQSRVTELAGDTRLDY